MSIIILILLIMFPSLSYSDCTIHAKLVNRIEYAVFSNVTEAKLFADSLVRRMEIHLQYLIE